MILWVEQNCPRKKRKPATLAKKTLKRIRELQPLLHARYVDYAKTGGFVYKNRYCHITGKRKVRFLPQLAPPGTPVLDLEGDDCELDEYIVLCLGDGTDEMVSLRDYQRMLA